VFSSLFYEKNYFKTTDLFGSFAFGVVGQLLYH